MNKCNECSLCCHINKVIIEVHITSPVPCVYVVHESSVQSEAVVIINHHSAFIFDVFFFSACLGPPSRTISCSCKNMMVDLHKCHSALFSILFFFRAPRSQSDDGLLYEHEGRLISISLTCFKVSFSSRSSTVLNKRKSYHCVIQQQMQPDSNMSMSVCRFVKVYHISVRYLLLAAAVVPFLPLK